MTRYLTGAQDERRRAVREAIVLPGLFLTVVLAGSFRVAAVSGAWSFEVPSLIFLVLAMLVIALLARSGAVDPGRLMHESRSPLENLSGGIVVVTLFAATAQLLSALTPERGLLRLLFILYFTMLFWNTYTMAPDAHRVRRSLLLVFASALVLKHVVLAAMFEPNPGFATRVVTLLLEGVTLGGIDHEPSAPATGYVLFLALLLYFAGLVLVPRAAPNAPEAVGAELAHRPDATYR